MTATAFAQPPERHRCEKSARARTHRGRPARAAAQRNTRRASPGSHPLTPCERTPAATTDPASPQAAHHTDRPLEGGAA
jgi:hypothetical protein